MNYNFNELHKELPLVKKGTTFSCLKCGRCCELEVIVTESELKLIEEKYPEKVKEVERIRKYKKISNGLYSLLFSSEMGSECIFLKNNLCTVHEYKPVLCKLYPFFPISLSILPPFYISNFEDLVIVRSNKSGEKYVISYDRNCPGINKGDSEPNWNYIVELWESYSIFPSY